MNTDLSPKYIKSIDQNTILWFECSNQYVIISTHTHEIIKIYLDAISEEEFITHLINHEHLNFKEAALVSKEFKQLLIRLNTLNEKAVVSGLKTVQTKTVRQNIESYRYSFGNIIVKVLYGSESINHIFHPQLAHNALDSNKEITCEFKILKVDDNLCLYKDGDFIFSSSTKTYHFVQGHFAMELTNAIHQKQQDQWLATFHASTIGNDQEAIMLIGDSGNGKSTLSALLMNDGFDLLADDFTPMYAEDLNIYRYPNAISIKKGAFNSLNEEIFQFEKLKTHQNGSKGIEIRYLPPSKCLNDEPKKLPCKKIVHVTYSKNTPQRFNQSNAKYILETLIPDSWLSPKASHAKLFLDWLSDVEFYELRYNDNQFALSNFASLFKA
ncbi:hypothetical protein [Sediminibacter sp. Hel_I_10]|uniref:hypothetical protein n=1 Tax=Sediminibacter sp. Hel_I_10 TaxID=1392490 RepID=UPI0004798C22|nr:hypothetical protein [Sediminibacter sp. Hel_I_10]